MPIQLFYDERRLSMSASVQTLWKTEQNIRYYGWYTTPTSLPENWSLRTLHS